MGGVTGNNFSGGSCGGSKFLGCIRQPLCLLNFDCFGCLLHASRLLLRKERGRILSKMHQQKQEWRNRSRKKGEYICPRMLNDGI
jgi:hypothetical protein